MTYNIMCIILYVLCIIINIVYIIVYVFCIIINIVYIIVYVFCIIINSVCIFSGYWPFGLVLCDMWQVSDVMLCTSSIMHMCVISIDRYICIKNPLKTRITSKHKVALKILVVWLIAFAIASPIIILGIYRPQDVLSSDLQCGIFNRYFVIYGSLAAFFIPLLLMLGTYSLTIHILRQKVSTGQKQEQEGGLRRMMSRRIRRMSQVPLAPRFRAKIPGNIDRKGRCATANAAELEPLNDTNSDIEESPAIDKKKNKYLFSALYTAAQGLALPVYQPIQGTKQKDAVSKDTTGNGHITREGSSKLSDNLTLSSHVVPGIICTNVSSEDVSAVSCQSTTKSDTNISIKCPVVEEKSEGRRIGIMESEGATVGNMCNCVWHSKRSNDPLECPHYRDKAKPAVHTSASNIPSVLVTSKNNSAMCVNDVSHSKVFQTTSSNSKSDSDVRDYLCEPVALGDDRSQSDNGITQDRRSSKVMANDGFHLSGNCIVKGERQCEHVRNVLDRVNNSHDSSICGSTSHNSMESDEYCGETSSVQTPSPVNAITTNLAEADVNAHCAMENALGVMGRSLNNSQCVLADVSVSDTSMQIDMDNAATCSQISAERDVVHVTGCLSLTSSTYSVPQCRSTSETTTPLPKLHASLPIVPPIIVINDDNIQSTGSLHVPSRVKEKKRNSCPDTKDGSWKDAAPKPKKSVWSRLSHPDTSLASLIEPLRKSAWARLSHPNVSHGNNDQINQEASTSGPQPPRFKALVKKHSAAFRVAAILTQRRENLKKKEMRTVRTEQKAVKVLGTMFFIFVLCWAPFFSLNLVLGICYESCSVEPIVFIVCLWLGYVSSILNPIIYTIFNNTFKVTFTSLIMCKYCKEKRNELGRNNSIRSNNRLTLGHKSRLGAATTQLVAGTEMTPLNNGKPTNV